MHSHDIVRRTIDRDEDLIDGFVDGPFSQTGLDPILPGGLTCGVIVSLSFNHLGILFFGIFRLEIVGERFDRLGSLHYPFGDIGQRGVKLGVGMGEPWWPVNLGQHLPQTCRPW